MANSDFGARQNKVYLTILQAGAKGCTLRELARNSQTYRELTPNAQDELIKSLVDRLQTVKLVKGGYNNKRNAYVAVKLDDE